MEREKLQGVCEEGEWANWTVIVESPEEVLERAKQALQRLHEIEETWKEVLNWAVIETNPEEERKRFLEAYERLCREAGE